MSNTSRFTKQAAMSLCAVAALTVAACGGPSAGAETPDQAQAHAGDERQASVADAVDETDQAAANPLEEKREHCVRAIEHAISLVEARGAEVSDEERALALGDGADACARDATRGQLDCVLAADVLEDVQRCEG